MAHKTIQEIETLKVSEIPKLQPKQRPPKKPNIKKIVLLVIRGMLLAIILVGIGWYIGHQATLAVQNRTSF